MKIFHHEAPNYLITLENIQVFSKQSKENQVLVIHSGVTLYCDLTKLTRAVGEYYAFAKNVTLKQNCQIKLFCEIVMYVLTPPSLSTNF